MASAELRPSALGLKSIRLLDGLDASVLDGLAAQCRWRRYPGGRRITSRDVPDHDVYLIVAGRVRITAFSSAGRQVTYRDLESGDWFGDLAAIDRQSRSADADALVDSVLAALSPGVFMRLLHEQPVVCDRILKRLVALVRDLTERVFDFSTLGVQNRVHAELLRLSKQAGVEGNAARIEPPPKHSDIASKISTYREQVTRELSALVKQGLLQRSKNALVIPDVSRLERLVTEVRRTA